MGEAILEMSKITKAFPGVKALNEVDFTVRKGEIHALIGENGAGKSTLMKVLTGIYKPDAGQILYKGQPFDPRDPKHAQMEGISIIHQELNLLNDLDVAENIFVSREPRKCKNLLIDDKTMHQEAAKLLQRLGLSMDPYEKVGNLSVAQKQMTEIAKALSVKSEVLILDEPTSALSEKEVQVLFRILRQLKADGVGIVYISHRLEEFDQIVDWVTVLRDGCFVASTSWAEQTIDSLVKLMVGREITEQFPPRHAKIGDVVLDVRNLSQKKLLQDVGIQVRAGEVVGLAGLMGAGRTEFARAIFGADPIISGEVYLHGKKIRIRNPGDAIQHGIIYLPEDRKKDGVFLDQSVAMNITIANLPAYSTAGVISQSVCKQVIAQQIEHLRIKTPTPAQLMRFLSGGNQQKAIIAREVDRDKPLIVAVQPTRGLDVGAIEYIHSQLVAERDKGKAILLVSLELDEVMNLSDRILVLYEGEIVGELDPKKTTVQELGLYMAGAN